MVNTVNDELLSRTVGHHVELQRLGNGLADEAVKRLNESDGEIFEVLHRHSSDGVLGIGGIEKALKAVRSINARIYATVEADLIVQLNQLARYEVDFVRDMVDTVMPVPMLLTRPKLKFLQAIITEEPFQGGLLSEWIAGMADGRYTRVRQAIRIGVAAHETTDEIVRRIKGRRMLGYKDGALQISRRSAKTIIPSIVNHVANRARGSVYGENDDVLTGVSWTAILDDSTCTECADLDGEEYTVEEAMEIEEAGTGPPVHLNCRCVLSPIAGSWQDLELPELSDAQKLRLDGKPPTKLKYAQWLRQQDKEIQDGILGKERAMMFRRGMPIGKFRDHTGRRYTLSELRTQEKKALAPKTQRKSAPLVIGTKRRNYGWRPDLPDQRDLLFGAEHPEDLSLPVRMSLRKRMPPVFNQGSLGACTSNALVAAAMFAFGPKTPMLSRLDLYYKERLIEGTVDEDSGAEIRDGIKALARWGVATEETWPYKIRSFRKEPSAEAAAEDQQYRVRKYERLRGHDDFMKCLAMEYPFVGGFTVYQNFDTEMVTEHGILPMPTVDQKVLGGHAVLFTGYDQDFHNSEAFKRSGLDANDVPSLMYEVRNSFGDGWGSDGYFWMPSNYIETRDLADDFWVLYR